MDQQRHKSFAHTPLVVLAVVAIVIALGGSSYAGAKLAKNSVGTKQLKDNAVKTSKVQDGSLTSADFALGQLPAGPRGPAGTALPNARFDAPPGDQDVKGGAVVNSVSLPSGTWVLLETFNAVSAGPDTTTTTRLECTMSGPSGALDFTKVRLGPQPSDPSQFVQISMTGALASSVPVTVTVSCASTAGYSLITSSRHLVAMPQAGLN